jgi:LDH2 family malate/lactate/ureidoglycolate dehydrogenase
MVEGTHYIPVQTLYQFMVDVFSKLGTPADEAKIIADVLISSDLRGIESHGVGRLKMYYDRIKTGWQKATSNFEIIRQSPTTALIDGNNGMGHVIAYRSMQLAIEKAKQYGMGSVAVRHSTHFGIDGYYPLMAVNAGLIGMSFTNARPSIAPTFGVQPMLGTNPISFGAPTDEAFPFIYDAATSITQRGKIEVLEREEKRTPEGWVINQQGNFLTDSSAILMGLGREEAALLPLGGAGEMLGGHKGYGLATMVEILSASLQSGSFLWALTGLDEKGSHKPFDLGHFFMAVDIETFVPLDEFKRTTGEILRQLRSSRKMPGQPRIYTAGEKEFENEQRVRVQGVPVVPNLQHDMKIIQQELELSGYLFPF